VRGEGIKKGGDERAFEVTRAYANSAADGMTSTGVVETTLSPGYAAARGRNCSRGVDVITPMQWKIVPGYRRFQQGYDMTRSRREADEHGFDADAGWAGGSRSS